MANQKGRSDTESLETALRRGPSEHYVLTLFVAGTTPNSMRAIANTREACDRLLRNRYSLTIIDMYQQPELAKADQIVAAPTLLRRHPLPTIRLVGTLGDAARVVLPIHLSKSDDISPRDNR